MISDVDRSHWRVKGWLALNNVFDETAQQCLSDWLPQRPDQPDASAPCLDPAMTGREGGREDLDGQAGDARKILKSLIDRSAIASLAERLIAEEIGPKGKTARFEQSVGMPPVGPAPITCLIAVDAMTRGNGCLEFANGHFDYLMAADDTGRVPEAVARSWAWEAVPLPAGGVIFFSARVPHHSGKNRSGRPRRAVYLTCKASIEGDVGARLPDNKNRPLAAALADGGKDGNMRIGTIGQLHGEPISVGGTL